MIASEASIGVRLMDLSMPEPNSGCRLWLGHLGGKRWDYGIVSVRVDGKAKPVRAHRAAWIEAHGPIPDGLFVCHRCDTPPCINVDHLFLGTHDDNMRDRSIKGRAPSVLDEVQVREILAAHAAGQRHVDLARRYGVGAKHISRIVRGEIWRHMDVRHPRPRRQMTMPIHEAAVAVLRETGNPAVMWGDTTLLHKIANKADVDWKGRASYTEKMVLDYLSSKPGVLIVGKTHIPQLGRYVRIFRLPKES